MEEKTKQVISSFTGYLDITPQQIIESQNKNNGAIVTRGILQRAESENQNDRIYPKPLLEREINSFMEKIQEGLNGGELDHPDCFREGAKALTANRGWQYIHEIKEGELVLSLNIKTKEIEAKPVKKIIYEKYNGKMIEINNRNIKTTVTPNHRFLLGNRNDNLKYIEAKELYNNFKKYSKYYIPKLGTWNKEASYEFVFPGIDKNILLKRNNPTRKNLKWTENQIEEYSHDLKIDSLTAAFLIGLYLSDGTTNWRNEWRVKQSKEKTVSIIKEKLLSTDLTWNYHQKFFIIKDPRIGRFFDDKFGDSTYTKKIPQFIKNLDSTFLNELIYWFTIGDGRFKETGEPRDIFSTSEKLIDDLHEILIKSGGSGNRLIYETKKAYKFANHFIYSKNKKSLHLLNISSTSRISLDKRMLNISEVDYNGNIVCLSVEDNENFYVMDNGKAFWTGNSSIVNLKNISHKINKLWWNGDDVMGEVEILNTPAGNIAKELIKSGIRLGISSRGLGTTVMKKGKTYVNEDYNIITWDLVSDPSTHKAYLYEINENVDPMKKKQLKEDLERIDQLVLEIMDVKI